MDINSSFDIRIVYDDICAKPGFQKSFGFSALIYNYATREYTLFDTGTNGNTLLHNIEMFNIDSFEINKVVISHSHMDHSGGLRRLTRINPNISIYVPLNVLNKFKEKFNVQEILGIENATEIEIYMIISGQFVGNSISEQALFLRDSSEDLIILVGCAHPGLEFFILKAIK